MRALRVVAVVVALMGWSLGVRAQERWKPNVGDRFVCALSHDYVCGDYGCAGTDTLQFEIVDTAYNADASHPNAVLAKTTLLAAHLYELRWGAGWDSIDVAHSFNDTTLLASTSGSMQVLFDGYNMTSRTWSTIPFEHDTSVVFQGTTYAAWFGASSSFMPEVGWFFALQGYQWPGACAVNCNVERWNMSLLAAIKGSKGVAREAAPRMSVSYQNGLLVLSNSHGGSIELADLLGRTIRAWRFRDSGERSTISLNVADVASGVYFVHVHGDGMEEVQKVAMVRW